MNVDLAKLLEQLLADIFRSGQNITAVQIQDAAQDAGFSASELEEVDWQQVYDGACEYPGVPAAYKGALQSPPSSPPPTVHQVVQEVQTITQVTNNNVNIFDNSVDNSVDNSTDVDNSIDLGDAHVEGDLDLNQQNNTAGAGGNANSGDQTGVAVGENATASGSGDANNASGGGGLINTGINTGNQNTGDEAAQVGGTTLDFGGGAKEPILLRDAEASSVPGVPGNSPEINIQTGDNSTQDNSDTIEHNETHGGYSPIESGDGGQIVDFAAEPDPAFTLPVRELEVDAAAPEEPEEAPVG